MMDGLFLGQARCHSEEARSSYVIARLTLRLGSGHPKQSLSPVWPVRDCFTEFILNTFVYLSAGSVNVLAMTTWKDFEEADLHHAFDVPSSGNYGGSLVEINLSGFPGDGHREQLGEVLGSLHVLGDP